MAFALGVNLSVARLGSVFNDLISPHLALSFSVPFAVWGGVFTCLISFGCAIALVYADIGQFTWSAVATDVVPIEMDIMDSTGSNSQGDHHRMRSIRPEIREERRSEGKRNRKLRNENDGYDEKTNDEYRNGLSRRFWHKLIVFPKEFWLLCLIMTFLYGTVIPFNTIHAAFLMSKWYPNDPTTGKIYFYCIVWYCITLY